MYFHYNIIIALCYSKCILYKNLILTLLRSQAVVRYDVTPLCKVQRVHVMMYVAWRRSRDLCYVRSLNFCKSNRSNGSTSFDLYTSWLQQEGYRNETVTLGIVQAVQRLATYWKAQGSNTGGGETFCHFPDRPCCLSCLLYSGYWAFPGVRAAAAWR